VDRAGAYRRGWYVIDARHEFRALRQWNEGNRVSADIADIRCTQRQEFAGTVERKFRRHGQIPAVVVTEKRLRAVARPFYWTSQSARRPGHQRKFGIRVIARTEIPPHVFCDHADLGRLEAKHVREIQFWANHPTTTSIKGDPTRLRFTHRQRRSDFHGYAGNARYLCLYANDVSSPPERLVRGCRVTDVRIKRYVRIHFRPDAHRSGFGCVDTFGTRR